MYSCLCACVHMFLALAGSWQRPDFKSTTILSCGLESGVWASRRCVSALLCARSVTVVTGMAGQRQTHVWGVTLNRDMMKHTHFDELTYAVCFNFHHTHTHTTCRTMCHFVRWTYSSKTGGQRHSDRNQHHANRVKARRWKCHQHAHRHHSSLAHLLSP